MYHSRPLIDPIDMIVLSSASQLHGHSLVPPTHKIEYINQTCRRFQGLPEEQLAPRQGSSNRTTGLADRALSLQVMYFRVVQAELTALLFFSNARFLFFSTELAASAYGNGQSASSGCVSTTCSLEGLLKQQSLKR